MTFESVCRVLAILARHRVRNELEDELLHLPLLYIYTCVCVCVCVHTYYIYVYVYMYVLEENKLNEIKVYRQHLRDFMNKLMNDEIVCDIFDDEFEKKKFPS